MPWLEEQVMDLRLCFVSACIRKEAPMTTLCARYGISRKTGYKWLGRYQEAGACGLGDRSSAPLTASSRLDSSMVARVLALRQARPSWGPRKLLARLSKDAPELDWPAASTVGDLLARRGLVKPRTVRPAVAEPRGPTIEATTANDSWAADFKGWFRTGDGVRCEPLTVSDGYSRYLLVCQAVPRPTFAEVRPLFEAAFRRYGLPRALRTDNGSPFANRGGLAGLTQMSVWLLKLDIWPDRIAPGRPDQNGRHERMHRTLAEEPASPPSADVASQQMRLDAWRKDYNNIRPHQALNQRCPAELYVPSSRTYPERLPDWEYPPDHQLRRVRADGYIKWQDRSLYLTEALVGEEVAISRRDDDDWVVRFRGFDLAILDAASGNRRCSGLARSGQPRTA
jgi:putative transposase